MKGRIKNRKEIAKVMTQSKLAGTNPDKHFKLKVGSRALYHDSERMTVQHANKKTPNATFSRVHIGNDTYIWCPSNKAGEEYLAGLSEAERNAFVTHTKSEPADRPESRRVVDSNPIKGLPNGHREADYFPSESSSIPASRVSTSYTKFEPEPTPLTDSEVDNLRKAISSGSF